MTARRRISILLSVVGVIILGFYREFIFVHINEQLFALWYDEPSRASDMIPFLKSTDYYTLYYSKWALTVLFASLFYVSVGGVLKLIFQTTYWKELGIVYAFLFGVAGIALGIGYLSNNIDDTYTVARFFMGIAQSPILLMLMIPAILLRNHATA
ncbi:MAG: hypothetical protein RLP15_06485 [Cryomorphaceae bacterium]